METDQGFSYLLNPAHLQGLFQKSREGLDFMIHFLLTEGLKIPVCHLN